MIVADFRTTTRFKGKFSFPHNLFRQNPRNSHNLWRNNYQYLLSQELGEINRQHKGLFVFMQIFGINKITLKNTA